MVLFFVFAGCVTLAFDVARLAIGGGWLLAVVFWVVAAWLSGLFRRDAWMADPVDSARYSRIDVELDGAVS